MLSKLGGKAIGTGLEAKPNIKDSLGLGMPAKAYPNSANEKKKAGTKGVADGLSEGMGKAGAAAGTGTREDEKSDIARESQLGKGVVDGSKKAGGTAMGKANEAAGTGTRDNEKPAKTESENEDKEDEDNIINTGNPDYLPGTIFEDEEGREYIFYKNAECYLARDGVDTGCGKQRIWENDKLGPPTGKYERYVWTDLNECRKGKGFCTEMQQVRGIQYIYDDENCERLIDIIKHEDFSCPLK